jgi:2-desacetyl-2-hydroxyethyl bacteriochlorophyllide A dehydrogenase
MKMKVLKICEPGKLEIYDDYIPELQSEDEVLIEIYYSGICKSDLELLNGTHPHLVNKNAVFPIIPGHEWSGVIVKTGKNVVDFIVGDRVVGDVSLGCGCCEMCKTGHFNLCPSREVIGSYRNRQGSFAQYLRTHKRSIYKIPASITMQEAAAIEPAATASYAVKKSKVKFGDKVLIIGDGPIGLFMVQMAKSFGASLVALIGSWPEKLKIAENTGADFTVSYRGGDAVPQIRKFMKDKTFDVIIDSSGNTNSINEAIDLIKPSGVIGLVSFYGKSVDINMNNIIVKDAEIQGILASPNMFLPTLEVMENKKIDAKPLITHIVDFKDIEKAFEIAQSRDEMSVKILVKIKEEN